MRACKMETGIVGKLVFGICLCCQWHEGPLMGAPAYLWRGKMTDGGLKALKEEKSMNQWGQMCLKRKLSKML